MKIKTSELTGAALDWAVAKCEGSTDFWFDTVATHWVKLHGQDRALRYGWAQSYLPSTDWAQGGPIIEREGVTVTQYDDYPNWSATLYATDYNEHKAATGPAPLIAAMRCYCCAKLGDEIDIPEELCQQQSS